MKIRICLLERKWNGIRNRNLARFKMANAGYKLLLLRVITRWEKDMPRCDSSRRENGKLFTWVVIRPLSRGFLPIFHVSFHVRAANRVTRFTFGIRVSLEIRATPRKSLATNHPARGFTAARQSFFAMARPRCPTFENVWAVGKYTSPMTDVVPRHVQHVPFPKV